MSYDTHHLAGEQIYQVAANTKPNTDIEMEGWTVTATPEAAALQNDCSTKL